MQMKAPTVKDRSPNPIQITAEQIIKDPSLHQMDDIKQASTPYMSTRTTVTTRKYRFRDFAKKWCKRPF